jgi:hypothetical protein
LFGRGSVSRSLLPKGPLASCLHPDTHPVLLVLPVYRAAQISRQRDWA